VKDGTYLPARWPGDAYLFARRSVPPATGSLSDTAERTWKRPPSRCGQEARNRYASCVHGAVRRQERRGA
jgi:hypothetical protein